MTPLAKKLLILIFLGLIAYFAMKYLGVGSGEAEALTLLS